MKKITSLFIFIFLVSFSLLNTSFGKEIYDPDDPANKPITDNGNGNGNENGSNTSEEDNQEKPETKVKSLSADLTALATSGTQHTWTCAHRSNTYKGIREGVPDNSVAAVSYAINSGANMIEVDPRATSDGIIVNMHNTTIDDTTNGTGTLSNMTYAKLHEFYLKGSKGLTEYKVPTFDEVLDAAKDRIYVCVDVKEKNLLSQIVTKVADKGMIDQVCYYTGSSTSYVETINNVNPQGIPFPWFSTALDVKSFAKYYKKVQMVQFDITNSSLDELMEAIKEAKLIGYANHLNYDSDVLNNKFTTVDKFINYKIEVIQTDYSDLIIPYLEKKGVR